MTLGRPIEVAPVLLGSDPEAFLEKWGQIVGSEKYVPEDGVGFSTSGPRVVRDGVQIELSLNPSEKRDDLGREISQAFTALKARIKPFYGVKVRFDPVVRVSSFELKELSDKSRQFGCAISYNLYGLEGPKDDPETYLTRSAGGHIHFGLNKPIFDYDCGEDQEDQDGKILRIYPTEQQTKLKRLVGLCDIIIGNTAVLMDREPGAEERRRNYGKAGEYRIPKHGLEYRTLSNFWLRCYPLMSLVMGLAKLSVSVLNTSLTTGDDLAQELVDEVDAVKVRDAIQTNDLVKAHETWDVVRNFIELHGYELGEECGLNPILLDKFDLFLKRIQQFGLSHWFPEDPMDHWVGGNQLPWERFLAEHVR